MKLFTELLLLDIESTKPRKMKNINGWEYQVTCTYQRIWRPHWIRLIGNFAAPFAGIFPGWTLWFTSGWIQKHSRQSTPIADRLQGVAHSTLMGKHCPGGWKKARRWQHSISHAAF